MTGDAFPLQALLPIFAYFAIGFLFRRLGLATAEHADFLFRLVFLATLPALIFVSVSQAALGRETALLPFCGFVVNASCASLAIAVGRLRGWTPAMTGAAAVSVGIMNMGFTFPFVLATLGPGALADAILFDAGNAVFVAFFIYPIAEYFGHGKAGFSLASVKRVMLSPIFVAIILALVVNLAGIDPGPVSDAVLGPVGAATTPLMLMAVGMSFGRLGERAHAAIATISIRMLGGGMIGLCLAWLIGLQGFTAAVVIVSAASPVGASAAAIASVAGLDRETAVAAVSMSALIGLVTTSVLLYITGVAFG